MYCLCYVIKNNKYTFKRQQSSGKICSKASFKGRLLAPGKETALGDFPHLVLHGLPARKPQCEHCLWAGGESCGRSISLDFTNPHLLAGA